MGRVELVRVEVACGRDDDARSTVKVAVAFFGLVPFVCDGEEDLGNGPLAVNFGWAFLWDASYASAALAVLKDLRRRCPSASFQSAKNLLALRYMVLLGSCHLLDTEDKLES